ncbi:hypothetical protein [uncultured Zobellia sp.]|uniref:hypothetical protein n=1 Tax=uncultured Zobellia sp. TaxID=255433 RepID=UPI002591531E|nr:hypothetical protein [uncultured Zobellia sp.]
MSKLLCAHFRTTVPKNIGEKLTAICHIIEPDNIIANKPKVLIDLQCAVAIMNPTNTIDIRNTSVLLGSQVKDNDSAEWDSSQNGYPDGSYAIFRNNETKSKFITDSVASRTIWYYYDDDLFLAATSQRAIILFLENFSFDERCIPWILSTGSLGPEYSWDKRIKRIPPSTTIILDKKTWEIKSETTPVIFSPTKKKSKTQKKNLSDTIAFTLRKMDINLKHWVLPLSGGYDSRGILYFMLNGGTKPSDIETITWGLKESLEVKGNDAQIAQEIAKTLKTPHKYYHTNLSEEPLKRILDRFILLGEGRIDHLGGYMDGFHIWKTLFEKGVQGIIRGDEGFGWSSVSSASNVRLYTGCALCSDFENLKDYCISNGIPEQVLPDHLKRKKKESLSTWRDRIYHEYRIPTVLAALSDLKLGYVEQLTPLLSNKILEVVRELPDKLRTDKLLFRKIIDEMEPKIPYADKGANANINTILQHNDIVTFIREELSSDYARSVLPEAILTDTIKKLKITDKSSTIKRESPAKKALAAIKKLAPKFIKNILIANRDLKIDPNILAFRLYIIVFMHKLCSSEFKNLKI